MFDVISTEAFRTFDGISWVNNVEQRRTWVVELVNPGSLTEPYRSEFGFFESGVRHRSIAPCVHKLLRHPVHTSGHPIRY